MKSLVGSQVIVFAANYIYTGELVEITHDLVWLKEPSIVYETGAFSEKSWKDVQRMPVNMLRIERSAIESMGEVAR